MKNTFESKYGTHQPNRGFEGTVSDRNLYVLANTSPISVFVELGNIQNTLDQYYGLQEGGVMGEFRFLC